MGTDTGGINSTGRLHCFTATTTVSPFVRPYSDEITLSLLERAKENGYSALIITLDTMSIGWRPHDLDTAYLPFFHSYGCQNGFSDPVFMARYGKQPETRAQLAFPYDPEEINKRFAQGDPAAMAQVYMGTEWVKEMSSGRQRSWDELKLIRDNWEGPLVLKGVQCAADAELAIDAGVEGIVVSNHGGRQVDGGVSALWSLEHIMKSRKVREAQAAGKFTVLFDSSIRSGPDIFKALALGAQAVLRKPFSRFFRAPNCLKGVVCFVSSLITVTTSGTTVRVWSGLRRGRRRQARCEDDPCGPGGYYGPQRVQERR